MLETRRSESSQLRSVGDQLSSVRLVNRKVTLPRDTSGRKLVSEQERQEQTLVILILMFVASIDTGSLSSGGAINLAMDGRDHSTFMNLGRWSNNNYL